MNFVKSDTNKSSDKKFVKFCSSTSGLNSESLNGDILAYDENVNIKGVVNAKNFFGSGKIVSGKEFVENIVTDQNVVSGNKIANKRSSEMEKSGKRVKVECDDETTVRIIFIYLTVDTVRSKQNFR